MRKIYLYTLLLLILTSFFLQVSAQKKEYVIREDLDWQGYKSLFPGHSVLIFDGAVNHDSLGFLPVYQCFIPGSVSFHDADIHLAEAVYEPLEIGIISEFPDLHLIRNQPRIFTNTITKRKEALRSLYLLPLRNNPENGAIEMLVSFTIVIPYNESKAVNIPVPKGGREYASHSVLREGDWYRIGVRETGIHRITYAELEAMGINPAMIDPRKIRLFGNGNGMLEEANSADRIDDLIENSIYLHGEGDGQFNQDDYILFYGEAPVVIKYNPFYLQYDHEVNIFTEQTYYFLTVDDQAGLRISEGVTPSESATHELHSFQEFTYHEKDSVNLIKSGKTWYGEVFNKKTDYDFPFELTGIDLSSPVYLKASLAGRSTVKTVFSFYTEGVFLTDVEVPSVLLGSPTIYARQILSNYESFYAKDDAVDIRISFEKNGSLDVGWLDFIELNYIRELRFTGGQLDFRDVRNAGSGRIAQYHVKSLVPDIMIWEVTDPTDISSQLLTGETEGVSFKAWYDKSREFIAFDGSLYYSPEFVEKVENQDLHSLEPADYIVVTHPHFMDQARRIADHHRQYNGLSSIIVTPQQIYNEFSSGAQDATALRDFVKMLYDRAPSGQEPRYLLLFGDASYDYRGLLGGSNSLVPAYQSRESLKYSGSFVTDDFFACLDYDEGSGGAGTMDMGVGRFPVNTIEEAEAMVSKSIDYMLPRRDNFGPWRNEISFIGDDEDNNTHVKQAESLAGITDSLGTVYNVNKIYIDAYVQLKTGSGPRYPEVNNAINNDISDGCLIMNYTGHGGEVAWAEERILDIPAIQSYRNQNSLPVFVTATCEFSRYDDPLLVSAGELVFLNPRGAGIGLFTTTRQSFSTSNFAYNKRFYYEAFRVDSATGEYPRLGDLIMAAKTPSNTNIKNFVLLGDPALMLAYPKMQVNTTAIRLENPDRISDTLYALSKVTVEGQIEDLAGNLLDGFNGLVYTSVYDKPVVYQTRANDPASKVADFYIQNKKIFKGEATVTDGKFSFTFIVPIDIYYQFGLGKISYYALDTVNLIDAHGYEKVWIGGSDDELVTDNTGPSIDLYLNTTSFQSGDLTTPSPLLIANLFDESGINTVGNGIGHDLVAIIDGNYQLPVVLNDHFNPETDSYQEGFILYGLGPFSDGLHTLTLKAWDVLNNSSEATIEFHVNRDARLELSQLKCQPNPYRETSSFSFSHNKPGALLDVDIYIYNLMGQRVTTLSYEVVAESTDSGLLYWSGKDDSGNELSEGLYVYTVVVTSDDGFTESLSQKIIHSR